jgi:hypothetical protein
MSDDLKVWAAWDGSSSWARGLADLAESVAHRWSQEGKLSASEAARTLSRSILDPVTTSHPSNSDGLARRKTATWNR